jgi:hypothetical protein
LIWTFPWKIPACGYDIDESDSEANEGKSTRNDFESEKASDSAEINKNVAELTRPKRDIMNKMKKDKKGRGRKRVHEDIRRTSRNWKHPLVFALIQEAQQKLRHSNSTEQWSPIAIVRQCQATSWLLFEGLTPQVLGRYIDKSGTSPTWSAAVLDEVVKNGYTPGMKSTRKCILDDHASTKLTILNQLKSLRQVGTSVSVMTVRAVVVANLHHNLPDLLAKFRCSDTWVRKFTFRELKWVMRKPTKAAQKVPVDAALQIEISFFRCVLTVRDAPIRHAAFHVNMDQTQLVYQTGGGLTFEVVGSTQVPVVGLEEKRAFMLVVAVSSGGDLLPFQVIFKGKTLQSVPSRKAPRRDEADQLGFRFEPSCTDTYWSNLGTMKAWVTQILVPYWQGKMVEYGTPNQECLLQLDAWKVHRSKEFREWLHAEYPWIVTDFIPAGCTGLWQPCDVGIQRPLKLAIKQCQQNDLVQTTLLQLESGIDPSQIKVDATLGTLRESAVSWLVSAYHQINKPDIICQVRQFMSSICSRMIMNLVYRHSSFAEMEYIIYHLRALQVLMLLGHFVTSSSMILTNGQKSACAQSPTQAPRMRKLKRKIPFKDRPLSKTIMHLQLLSL